MSHCLKKYLSQYQTRRNRYPNTQIHDRLLFWLGTGTSIKSGEVKLLYGIIIKFLVDHNKTRTHLSLLTFSQEVCCLSVVSRSYK